MTTALRTGQVAAAARVGRETLRYYERRGLLAPPERTLGGHRVYPPETITRVRLIKAAQQLGFTLDEIAALTDSRRHRRSGNADLATSAQDKLAQIEQRIAALQDIAALLHRAIAAGCKDLSTCATSPECPLPLSPPCSTTPDETDR